jgi:hypothetical protein
LGIMKDTLPEGEDTHSGFGKFSVRRKNARRRRNPQTKKFSPGLSKGFGVQGIWGIMRTHQ